MTLQKPMPMFVPLKSLKAMAQHGSMMLCTKKCQLDEAADGFCPECAALRPGGAINGSERAMRQAPARQQYRRGQRYIEELTEPQGLRVLIECPCKHPSCFWAKASKPMIIKAARTNPSTRFFIMATTPRG
jgi:hypothetical protein